MRESSYLLTYQLNNDSKPYLCQSFIRYYSNKLQAYALLNNKQYCFINLYNLDAFG